MPINLDLPLVDPRGRAVKRHRTDEEIAAAKAAAPPLEPDQKEPDYGLVGMSIAEACIDALLDHGLVDSAGKPKLTGAEKFARFQLVEKIKGSEGGPVPLNTAEIALLETVTGEAFLPAIVGAIWNALRSPV